MCVGKSISVRGGGGEEKEEGVKMKEWKWSGDEMQCSVGGCE